MPDQILKKWEGRNSVINACGGKRETTGNMPALLGIINLQNVLGKSLPKDRSILT
jgi:hypothetical protein